MSEEFLKTANELILLRNRRYDNLVTITMTEIFWERINVYFTVRVTYAEGYEAAGYNRDDNLDFYLVSNAYRTNGKLKIKSREKNENGDIYVLSLNITNPGYNQCLPILTYRFVYCNGTDILGRMIVTPELTKVLPERSREFLYDNKIKVYCVDFSIAESDEAFYIEMKCLNASKQNLKAFIETPGKKEKKGPIKTGKAFIKKKFFTKQKIRSYYKKIYNWLVKRYSDKSTNHKPVILFMTEQSPAILETNSNLFHVYRRMVERGLDKDYEMLFSARTIVGHHYSKKSWLDVAKKIAKADIILVDDHIPLFDWLTLDPKTKLVQLWHAGAGFKSSGYSRWGHKGCPSPVCCHRQYDYAVGVSSVIAEFHSEVFGINKEQILVTGMPRLDEFLNEDYRREKEKELYETYPACKGKKVILFAPTYRGLNRATAYYPYELIDFDGLYDLCGEEYIVLFKMHPWVSSSVPIPEEYSDKFFDLNEYKNINDLLYITDLLITDYSSNIFEFSLMHKPMLFFAFDEVQYAYSRGFHRDYEESVAGKICHTFDELLDAIRNKDFEFEKVQQYVDKHFDYIDTGATDRVIDWFVLGNIPAEMQKKLDDIDAENAYIKKLDFREMKKSREMLAGDLDDGLLTKEPSVFENPEENGEA